MPKSKSPRKKTSPGVYRKPSKNSIMKDLHELDKACEEMLASTAQFAPYLVNRELVEAGDVEKIENNAKILTRDTIQLKTELSEIRREIPKKLNPEKPDDVMKGLSLGRSTTPGRRITSGRSCRPSNVWVTCFRTRPNN